MAVPLTALAQPLSPVAQEFQEVAAGVYFLPGATLPGRGPDGATVIFDAPEGLVVVDTGRHSWRTDAILSFADGRHRPVAAILNTHWHLDHSSGNVRLKERFPTAPLYTTGAVRRALAPGGFIAREAERAPVLLAEEALSPTQREEVGIFLETMGTADRLRPDVEVSRSGVRRIGGRRLGLRVAANAVTDADLWVYDPRTRVVVLGDLVTFPSPYFETACPEAWRDALAEVASTRFRIALPGHGAAMTRADFSLYRAAFGAFVDCVRGKAEAQRCSDIWVEGVAPLLGEEAGAHAEAASYATYYVQYLRDNGGRSPDCLAD